MQDPTLVGTVVDSTLGRIESLAAKYHLLTIVGYEEGSGHKLMAEDRWRERIARLQLQVREATAQGLSGEHELLG